jgi:hypothetical protein
VGYWKGFWSWSRHRLALIERAGELCGESRIKISLLLMMPWELGCEDLAQSWEERWELVIIIVSFSCGGVGTCHIQFCSCLTKWPDFSILQIWKLRLGG